ncbi:MAG: hypothetical protein HY702_02980 [Gemmatimonadetes bacterium]|nr:hypothetical protein [Gemmatimonadota bacterium]
MQRDADVPADLADSTLIALAEEMHTRAIFTLDRRGFSTFRAQGVGAFEIRP